MAERANTLSLWLLPPEDSELFKALQSLIHTSMPSLYPISIPPRFSPHVTLTANTIPKDWAESQPRNWLEKLQLPEDDLKVTIQNVHVGEIFFQKLIMLCEKTAQLCDLAATCRAVGDEIRKDAREWIDQYYKPHCSLMYSDLPQEEVRAKLEDVNEKIQEAKKASEDATIAKGGMIWLVETWKDVDDWQPIARRELPNVEWYWAT